MEAGRQENQSKHAVWFEQTFSSQADTVTLHVGVYWVYFFLDLYCRSDVHIDYTQIHLVANTQQINKSGHVQHRSCPPTALQLLHSLTPKSASAPGFYHTFFPSHARLGMQDLELHNFIPRSTIHIYFTYVLHMDVSQNNVFSLGGVPGVSVSGLRVSPKSNIPSPLSWPQKRKKNTHAHIHILCVVISLNISYCFKYLNNIE